MTELQKRTIQAIVNVFETGAVLGDYGSVTAVPGDAGHLTYGRSQASLASGNLYRLLRAYCDASNSRHAAELVPYLERLCNRDVRLDHDGALRGILERAGYDPVMRATQDEFFDRAFFMPALKAADTSRLESPLSRAVVYDSFIHGGWQVARGLTVAKIGLVTAAVSERAWVACYIDVRRRWLLSCAGLLPSTVYRVDAFGQLITCGRWDLELPFTVRGVMIDQAALEGRRVPRILRVKTPNLRGNDVAAVQRELARQGYGAVEDGIFSPATEAAVRAFQRDRGLKPDGIVGPQTRAALGLAG